MAITLTSTLAIALNSTLAPTQVITNLAPAPPLTTDFVVSLENS